MVWIRQHSDVDTPYDLGEWSAAEDDARTARGRPARLSHPDDDQESFTQGDISNLDHRHHAPLTHWEVADDAQQTSWLKSALVQNCYLGIWSLFFALSWATALWVISQILNR